MFENCRKMPVRLTRLAAFILAISIFNTGCGKGFPASNTDSNQSLDDGATPVEPLPPLPEPEPDLNICSELSFANVQWATRFDVADRDAFALSLNISGSYEGNSGWANLTNNFDGQGLSMGLLNQTLGTGSLEPLLYKFRQAYPKSYGQVLSSEQKLQMDEMLDTWGKAKGLNTQAVFSLRSIQPIEILENAFVGIEDSTRDQNKFYAINADQMLQPRGAAETAAVKWALNNLYADGGTTFKATWRSALKALAAHPDYVTLQIEAAEYLHDRALAYQAKAGFTELRGYLMLFDIAVQNGTINSSQFNAYSVWRQANPSATQQEAMLKLIDIRAAASNPKYQDDVRRRKRTIVLGEGTVHGEFRQLAKEYCYVANMTYPVNSSLP